MEWLVGVDEAGRGPLAGPVVVGAACVSNDFDWSVFSGLTDSKKLSAKKREALFETARELQRSGALTFATAQVSAPVIDRVGIVHAVTLGVSRTLRRIPHDPQHTHVKLDGLLYAPKQYVHQETLIKGDEREPIISLASILAKVTRDRYMASVASRYVTYGFDIHKGYGTRAHRLAIRTYGMSTLHRKSFCTRLWSNKKTPS